MRGAVVWLWKSKRLQTHRNLLLIGQIPLHVAATRDRAGGGLAFADEDHRAIALFLLLVEMILAVLQLRDAQHDRLGAFARELLHVLQFLPQLLRVLHLRKVVLGKTAFRSRNSSNFARHYVRLKTGSRVQGAAGVLSLTWVESRLCLRLAQAQRGRS